MSSSDLLSYTTVMKVYQSWDIIKGADRRQAAEAIYRRLFEINPEAKALFGLDDGDNDNELESNIKSNPIFLMHVRALFEMIDVAVNSLGPDLEPLANRLTGLGRRHKGRGVNVSHLRSMEQAFVEGIGKLLVERNRGAKPLDANVQDAWRQMFQFLTHNMAAGLQ